jgi:hypothetical protein
LIKRRRNRKGRIMIMKTLNQGGTKVFCQLIDKMQGKQHLKIEIENYMPLTIEKIADNIKTHWGTASLYSLLHFYIQYGDLMQDPEMCFIVVDERNGMASNPENVKIVPYMFQQANMGIYQESITFKNGELDKYNKSMQYDHTIFANQWLQNIGRQGFLR